MSDNTEPRKGREALLHDLGQPFPRDAVKQRFLDRERRRQVDYVEGHTVIHRLNNAAPGWDWIIKGMDWRANMLVVWGDLTIPGLGTRSGIGISENMTGDVVKGASTDALKKAATLFGVALELYGPDYEQEPATGPQNTSQHRPKDPYGKPPPRQPNQEPTPINGAGRVPQEDAIWLKDECDRREISDQDRQVLLNRLFGKTKLGLLTHAEASELQNILVDDDQEDLQARIAEAYNLNRA